MNRFKNGEAVKIRRTKRGHYTPHFCGRPMHLLSEIEKYTVTTRIEAMAKRGHNLARAYIKQEHGERTLRWIVRH